MKHVATAGIKINRKYLTIAVGIIICIVFLFSRAFELKERAQLSYDQINNAWAAYRIIAEHKFPLEGPVAKLSSITIGPLYYYYVAIFYWITDLDPVASPIIALVTGIINFGILYCVTKRLFGEKTALIAAGINATSVYLIFSDRGQVPINFIPSIGLLLFYYLYEILRGKSDKIPWLAAILGVSFHIHFTSVFYPVIIAMTLPWWPKIRTNIKYYLYAVIILVVSFSPMIIQSVIKKQPFWQASGSYISSSNHGFHLRRVLQLAHDAFIEFESILMFRFFRPFVFFVLPLFVYVYNIREKRKNLWIGILLSLWIIIPWIGFSLYTGEITNYYFSISRYIVLMIISYVLYWFWKLHNLSKIILCVFAVSFLFLNTQKFFNSKNGNLIDLENEIKVKAQKKDYIPYIEGDPRSYLYTIYTRNR